MIKPVQIGLRILAVLARTAVDLLAAPVRGLYDLTRILCEEVFVPVSSCFNTIFIRLGEKAESLEAQIG
jgi:hypothetical protein